ncbi:Elongation of very long chain fatty acids protein, partial [Caligus rogercresseyi]
MEALQSYTDYAWSQRDKRRQATVAIILSYLLIVKVLGPAFMKNRAPFELKWPMRLYNLFQVGFSIWLFYYGLIYGWARHYSL